MGDAYTKDLEESVDSSKAEQCMKFASTGSVPQSPSKV